jgi:hypothetical protein
MKTDIAQAIAELRRMTPADLRKKYLEVFGESSRSGNKEFLFKRIAWRIQSLAEGTLSERARQRADELARDADIRTTMPRPRETLPQSQTLVVAIDSNRTGLPTPGTVLTRQYRGRIVQVTVLPKGFEHEGQVYRSLSGVAKAVTGSHWNGNLFFGLKTGRNP